MTRTREENAADLAQEDAQRTAIRDWVSGWRGALIKGIIAEHDHDEEAMAEALAGYEMMKDESAAGFSPDMVIRETITLLQEIEARKVREIADVFGEPDILTGAGNRWFHLDTQEKADLAGKLGQTAVGMFWKVTREKFSGEDSHEWLIMLDEGNRAAVTMTAKKDGAENLYSNIADCHVTGFRNEPAFTEHEGDIRAACGLLGLVCHPNHMGEPLREVHEDSGPGL